MPRNIVGLPHRRIRLVHARSGSIAAHASPMNKSGAEEQSISCRRMQCPCNALPEHRLRTAQLEPSAVTWNSLRLGPCSACCGVATPHWPTTGPLAQILLSLGPGSSSDLPVLRMEACGDTWRLSVDLCPGRPGHLRTIMVSSPLVSFSTHMAQSGFQLRSEVEGDGRAAVRNRHSGAGFRGVISAPRQGKDFHVQKVVGHKCLKLGLTLKRRRCPRL